MQIREAIEAYQYAILHHSQATQDWYLTRLNAFAFYCENVALHENKDHAHGRILNLEGITPTELRKYIHYLSITPSKAKGKKGKLLSSYTVHGHARTLRTFLKWCTQESEFEDYVSEKTANKMSMPKIEQRVIEIFSTSQLKDLFDACKKEYVEHLQVRDLAILSVLVDTGIRAGELCGLTLEHVHIDPKDAFITVMGKGKKEREVGLGIKSRTLLHKFIRRYRNAGGLVSATEKHVFLSRFNLPLSVNGLDQIIYRLSRWAHITGVRCSAHTFRHTFACNYLKNGGDVFKLSRLLGPLSRLPQMFI
jgi:integrase/recombinase XerD